MQILIFNTLQEATDAIATIDGAMGYPFTNNNFLTREPVPTAQKTETWAIPEQCKTGGYFIPKPIDVIAELLTGFTEETFDKTIHRIIPLEAMY